LPTIGRILRGFRAGLNTTPEHADGFEMWAQYACSPMSERALRSIIALLGLGQLAFACWIMFATQSFGETVASFDGFNTHDLRDFATFYLALGFVLLVAAVRPAWRFPLLVLAALENAFHTINHAVDVGDSDPSWLGPIELTALLLATALFSWLALTTAARKT
jgi:hypothetical protein